MKNYTLELFFGLEMVCYCCFSLGRNLDFLDFLQKKFKTSTTETFGVAMAHLTEQAIKTLYALFFISLGPCSPMSTVLNSVTYVIEMVCGEEFFMKSKSKFS